MSSTIRSSDNRPTRASCAEIRLAAIPVLIRVCALVITRVLLAPFSMAEGDASGAEPIRYEGDDEAGQGSELHPAPGQVFAGPAAPTSQIESDREEKDDLLDLHLLERWDAWKDPVYDRIGLKYGFDYNSLGYVATSSPGDIGAASGVVRLFGSWDFFGRGTKDTGGLIYKIEHRHRYTDTTPAEFGAEIGYAGFLNPLFTDQEFRVTHLHWRQSLLDGRLVGYLGWLDITDYTDVYALASPWTAFSNLAFSTGGGAIGGLPDGALGLMVGGFVTDKLYANFGLVDANADPTHIGQGFETFFGDFETFKSFEVGWTSDPDLLFVNNVHVTFWQIDARAEAGTPSGWGVNFSATAAVAKAFLPFLRGGWAKDGGSLYEGTVSAGIGYQTPGSDSLLGVGVNWSRPNQSTFGADLGSQFTGELFYRAQLTQRVQITPSMQLIGNPAENPDKSFLAVFGLRLRAAF